MTPRGTPDQRLLLAPEGGSLNELAFVGDVVVKRYAGRIPRGHDKLRREYVFLRELPERLAAHFARPVLFVDEAEPRRTELHLHRHPEPAVAKAILRGLLTPDQTRGIVATALHVLLDELYPIRQSCIAGAASYARFHATRLASAITALSRYPGIGDVVTASELRVNGVPCPSPAAAAAWLDEHAPALFAGGQLVAAHGDPHLDNILAPTDGAPRITFVDPRGDHWLPPHYDFAKVLKAARAGYDLIHYGFFDVNVTVDGTAVDVDIELDHSYDQHYRDAFEVLLEAVPAYADAEHLTRTAFLNAVVSAEVVHVISFSWYHAHRPSGCDPRRVIAYLAVAALLARELASRDLRLEPELSASLAL